MERRKLCGEAVEKHIDDVKFISGVINYASATLPYDTKRVYATGISNGAEYLSFKRELSDGIAAIAQYGSDSGAKL